MSECNRKTCELSGESIPELGDGEPSPAPRNEMHDVLCQCTCEKCDAEEGLKELPSIDGLMVEYCETRAISRTGKTEAISFAQFVRQRSGAAQEVSPPSPEPQRAVGVVKALRQWESDTGRKASASEVNAFVDGFEDGYGLGLEENRTEGDTRELKAALKLVTEKFRQHFREGDHTLHWRDALDALAVAETLLG